MKRTNHGPGSPIKTRNPSRSLSSHFLGKRTPRSQVVISILKQVIPPPAAMADHLRQRRRAPPATADGDAATTTYGAYATSKTRRRGSGAAARPRTAVVVLGTLAFFAAALAVVAHWHVWLPEPRDAAAPVDVFSEGRARRVLGGIMRLGYRPVGSRVNEELVPAYLLSEVRPPACAC